MKLRSLPLATGHNNNALASVKWPRSANRDIVWHALQYNNVPAMEGGDIEGKGQLCLRSGDRMVKRDEFGPTALLTGVRVLDEVTRDRDKRGRDLLL